jgi:hypothetical protein
LRLHANRVSVGESGGEYFQVSFGSEAPRDDDFDLSEPDHPYLVIQRQFEDDDGGVCYIETHDHDTYAGHFRLKLIEFTATRLAFEIARTDHKYVEVTCDLDPKQFNEGVRPVINVWGARERHTG